MSAPTTLGAGDEVVVESPVWAAVIHTLLAALLVAVCATTLVALLAVAFKYFIDGRDLLAVSHFFAFAFVIAVMVLA